MAVGFEVGQLITVRQVRYGKAWLEAPVRVLRDDGEVLVTYLFEGSPFSTPDPDFPWGEHPWLRRYGSFQGHGVVIQQRAGEAHAVMAFWTGSERVFSHWYVNFQDPFRRTPRGIETFDHELDLIVWPDGRREWKDVEVFEECVAIGRFTQAEAAAIRAEADRVAAELDDGGPWWDQGWSAWVPPGSWAIGVTG